MTAVIFNFLGAPSIEMYENIDAILKSAEEFVLANDRAEYSEYYKYAEIFCAENPDLLIAGDAAIALTLKKNISYDLIVWDIYSANPLDTAKKLADYLYKKANPPHFREEQKEYIYVGRDLANKEYTIVVNTRMLFRLTKYMAGPQVGARKGHGWFTGRTLNYVNPLLIISDLCRSVYNLSAPDEAVIDLICELWGPPKKIKARPFSVMNVPDYVPVDKLIQCHGLLYMGGVANVGELLDLLPKGHKANRVRIESSPRDFRLEWWYITTKDDKKVMEWVNTASYEIFPYEIVGGLKIASAMVRLRFIILKLLRLDEARTAVHPKIREILETEIASIIENEVRPKPANLIPVDNYAGITTVEKVARNIINKEKGYWHNYYPARVQAQKNNAGELN